MRRGKVVIDRIAIILAVLAIAVAVIMPWRNMHLNEDYTRRCHLAGGDKVTIRILPGGAIRSCWVKEKGTRVFLEEE